MFRNLVEAEIPDYYSTVENGQKSRREFDIRYVDLSPSRSVKLFSELALARDIMHREEEVPSRESKLIRGG